MKTAAFIFSVLCFLLYLHNIKKGSKANIKTDPPKEKAHISEIGAYISQNNSDSRIETLYKMLETAQEQEIAQQARIERINQLNQYGVVVNEKNEKRAYDELYRIQRRRISIENQINRITKDRK